MTEKPKDYPFYDIVAAVKGHAEKGRLCFQKFTCGHCGARQTIEEANKMYTRGLCEECKHETNLLVTGCNFMLMAKVDRDKAKADELFADVFGKPKKQQI